MEQSAVEFIVEQLAKNGILHSSDIAKAKEMEKEQIIEAFITSRDPYGISVGNSHSIKKAEQYYNETFKSE